jgi:hypothetical protein
MTIDLRVAGTIMSVSLVLATITNVLAITWLIRKKDKKQFAYTLRDIIWLFDVMAFYIYTLLIKPHYDLIHENDVWYFAWGSAMVLHSIVNTLGILIARITIHD